MRELFDDPSVPMLHSMINSVVIAVVQTAGVLVLASLAGYGLARIPYRHANGVFLAILLTLMVPAAVTFVPTFVLVSTLGWVSTLRGLIVPGLFQAFAAFLFRQYFLNFPRELEEAARIDGLNYWGTFWRIVVPNSRGFFAAIATITFISTWNSFLWPLAIGQDERSWTVQIAVSTFLTSQTVNLHELSMAAVFAILPLLLVFFSACSVTSCRVWNRPASTAEPSNFHRQRPQNRRILIATVTSAHDDRRCPPLASLVIEGGDDTPADCHCRVTVWPGTTFTAVLTPNRSHLWTAGVHHAVDGAIAE